MRLIPDMPPKLFSLSAVAIGYFLIDDLTANEQNALGNWLMLVAQVLCTNAFYKQVQQERYGTPTQNNPYSSNEEIIVMLKKMIDAINKEVEDLKKNKS